MNRIDDLTFNAMYSVLQSGMWLLNDLEAYLRPLDMSQARLSILLEITASDGIVSPNEIARITGKSRPGITRTIEKLSESGYILISRDFSDGRRKKLALTPKGEELLNQIIPEYNRRILAMSSELSDDEKLELIRLLGKINFLDKDKRIGGE
ncbi:MAG: MarR family transcriptional regulator [Spirochaetales bacterium]|nr:MarR family transcriptional regulator [Spirochaetales bacterium]